MDPMAILAIAKEAKGSINDKIDGVTGGILQAGNIYGMGTGFGGTQQPIQQPTAPSFKANQTQSSIPSQYSFMPDSSNYIPNTDFAQRVTGKQPSKLFQFLSNGG